VLSEKGDNFAPRPFNEFTVYVTIIDDSGEGLIKIVEINNFDFVGTVFNAQLLQDILKG
jgi:hypothetical protein